jgi:hypothetical protein
MKEPIPREKLRRKIKERFKSLQAFAFNVDASSALVSRICCGWVTISPDRAEEWADTLDCKVEDLFPEFNS